MTDRNLELYQGKTLDGEHVIYFINYFDKDCNERRTSVFPNKDLIRLKLSELYDQFKEDGINVKEIKNIKPETKSGLVYDKLPESAFVKFKEIFTKVMESKETLDDKMKRLCDNLEFACK